MLAWIVESLASSVSYGGDIWPVGAIFCFASAAAFQCYVDPGHRRNEERLYPLHQDHLCRNLCRRQRTVNLISTINCNEQSVLVPPPRLAVEQEGDQRQDRRTVNANRVATANKASRPKTYKCHQCGIIFPDYILYSMHAGYHNFDDPQRCSRCGRRSNDMQVCRLRVIRGFDQSSSNAHECGESSRARQLGMPCA